MHTDLWDISARWLPHLVFLLYMSILLRRSETFYITFDPLDILPHSRVKSIPVQPVVVIKLTACCVSISKPEHMLCVHSYLLASTKTTSWLVQATTFGKVLLHNRNECRVVHNLHTHQHTSLLILQPIGWIIRYTGYKNIMIYDVE